MSNKLIIRPRVYDDLDEIAEYIQHDNPQAAIHFLERTLHTFELIAGMPGIGAPYALRRSVSQDLRCFPVRDFRNYLVFYQRAAEAIEIIRVLHGARNIPPILRKNS